MLGVPCVINNSFAKRYYIILYINLSKNAIAKCALRCTIVLG